MRSPKITQLKAKVNTKREIDGKEKLAVPATISGVGKEGYSIAGSQSSVSEAGKVSDAVKVSKLYSSAVFWTTKMVLAFLEMACRAWRSDVIERINFTNLNLTVWPNEFFNS